MPNRQIRYIAVGNISYLEMAILSARSICANTKLDVPILIQTNLIESCSIDEHITIEKIPYAFSRFGSRNLKTSISSRADKTLYLDCDIVAVSNIDDIWNHESIALAHAYYSTIEECRHAQRNELDYTLGLLPANFPHYNSGVILFDKSSESLFKRWHQEWIQFARHDQLALARAIYKERVTVNLLDESYNCPPDRITESTKLIHFSGSFKTQFPF